MSLHHHSHIHPHSHDHSHDHGPDAHGKFGCEPPTFGNRQNEIGLLRWVIRINLIGMIVEIIGGFMTHSLALLSDAGHMFSHLFSLLVAYIAILLANRPKDTIMSFGYVRMEILAAFFNGVTVFGIVFLIVIEGIRKLLHPEPVLVFEMAVVAVFGLAVNILCAWLLRKSSPQDLNIKGVIIHLLSDTFSSVAILVAGVVIYFTGWHWVDTVASLIIASLIAWWGAGLLRSSGKILLQSVPDHIDVEEVIRAIRAVPGVKDVHDVHIWELTAQRYVMTGHLYTDEHLLADSQKMVSQVNNVVRERFAIGHTTFQVDACASSQLDRHA